MKSRTHNRTFEPRFAELVRAGIKRQTIRPRGKEPPRPGDTLNLRQWTGQAYRSRQRTLRDGQRCRSVTPVLITEHGLTFDPGTNHERTLGTGPLLEAFARADGFTAWPELRAWFEGRYTLPFEGHLITW